MIDLSYILKRTLIYYPQNSVPFAPGILEADDDMPDDGADDEIVLELRKKQQELKALTQHNQMVIKRMVRQAKEEMGRQDLRRKMSQADHEVRRLICDDWRLIAVFLGC